MSELQILTNYHWREFVYGFELPDKVRQEYADLEDLDERVFIHYKDDYLLDEFMGISETMRLHQPELGNWQGYMSDSFFSGLLIRYSDDFERYQIATYFN